MSEERAILLWQQVVDAKQTVTKYRNALAGDGAGTVDVTNEPGYIWCRYSADQSKVSKVFSMVRGIPEDFPIQVGRRSPDDEFEQVLWIDWTQYQDIVTQDTVDNFNTSNHGESHNAASGADPAPIDLRNILEMRGRAQDTADLTIKLERGQYEYGDEVKRYPGEDLDLTASVPGVAGHRYVLVYVDGATNAAASDDGVIVPLANAAPIPDLTVNTLPICLVDLENGQTTITEDDIYDWRFLWKMVSNLAPIYVGTNAERLALVLANLAELTRFYTTDTDKIWEVWEAAWRLIYPPSALSDSDGDSGTPWSTDASGILTGTQNLVLDDGVGDSPQIQLRGGSNDDTADIFLDDSGVAGQSDLAINLPGTDANSVLNIRDQTGAQKVHVDAEGQILQFVFDAVTNTFSLWRTLEHASTGAVANGFAGRVLYRLEDNGNTMEDAAALQVEWENAAAAAEGTIIRFYGRKAGAVLGEFVHFGATEAVFNETSADIDFRVEGDGATHLIFAQASNDRVGINESSPDVQMHVTDDISGVIMKLESLDTTNGRVGFDLETNHTTQDGDYFRFFFRGDLSDVVFTVWDASAASFVEMMKFEYDNTLIDFNDNDLTNTGNILPGSVKGNDLGSASAEWDNIYYVTANTGTSRLVDSTRMCPVCGEQMKRGTGTVNVQGEDADYALVFCIACGVAGVEEWRHLPQERLAERRPAPMIVFEGMRVKSHGRSRTISVDFRYGNGEGAIKNSTALSDAELDSFMAMNERERDAFLLQLGQREWDAREEQRIMRDERDQLQSQLDALTQTAKGRDLAKRGEK